MGRPPKNGSRSSTRLLVLGGVLLGLTKMAPAQMVAPQAPGDDPLLFACQQTVACDSHLERATQLYREANYQAAIVEYQAAYSLQPYALVLYNIARLHHKQGQLAEAIVHYQKYLATNNQEQAERARALLATAQQELTAQQVKAPTPPPIAVAAPPQVVSVQGTSAAHHKPISVYRKWWFWTVIGVAAVGGATIAGVGIYASGPDVSGIPAGHLAFGK